VLSERSNAFVYLQLTFLPTVSLVNNFVNSKNKLVSKFGKKKPASAEAVDGGSAEAGPSEVPAKFDQDDATLNGDTKSIDTFQTEATVRA